VKQTMLFKSFNSMRG
jgi:hypothetical protein